MYWWEFYYWEYGWGFDYGCVDCEGEDNGDDIGVYDEVFFEFGN